MTLSKYRMPAEWALHEGTMIQWPVASSMVWPENYEELQQAYVQVILAAAAFEKVWVLVNEEDYEGLQGRFGDQVSLLVVPHNDAWARDSGPTYVIDSDGQRRGVSWSFNAWGEKYKPYDLDNGLAIKFMEQLKHPYVQVPMVMEGGSIHVDGAGTLLTTEECLLNPNRNPEMSRDEIEILLKEALGVSQFIWLKQGLFGDETDGHIDNIACFAKEGTIVIQTCHDIEDPNSQIAKDALDTLAKARDAKGNPLEVIEIPQPPARYYKGERLTLSYLNYYLVNGGLLLPVFGGDAVEADQKAKAILQSVFPDRKIVPIDGMGLIKEGGNIHCITQQVPKV